MSDCEKPKSNIKIDSLLSLYGSMPPKGEKSQKDWEVIRNEARDENTIRDRNI